MEGGCLVYRQMTVDDLFRCNNVNLDKFTENFHLDFYMQYLIKHPEQCIVAEAADGTIAGYIIGKIENGHGHVTALTVAPEYRRCGVAQALMNLLEEISTSFGCLFVDLFVRESNRGAIAFYKNHGYSVYRVVTKYYAEGEDALDMRKSTIHDPFKTSLKPPASFLSR